ncbi:LiaI-LiaF-like domain-containing protein [Piscinibacter sp.]|uniref:LiaI-LiaF-like domain-containing protein n=1 Tax=Piscinibacter sp. TaxID=1903157 RepID=UPI0039E4FFBC
MKTHSLIAPTILIGLGSAFMLSKLGVLPPLGPLFAQGWPLILIVVGASMLLRRAG